MNTPQLTSRLRGGGCGVLVGALAVAAHGVGGGGVPRSAEIALLLLVSLGAGAFAYGGGPRLSESAIPRTISALVVGQWVGHFALSTSLDHHDVLHLPGPSMTAAHIVAAFACAALIFVAERLYLLASSVIRAVLGSPSIRVRRAPRWAATVAVVQGSRHRGPRCPRAPPLFA